MKPDIEKARNRVKRDVFSEYSEAYIVSNEYVHSALKFVPKNANILTIAGSGDQAMFCSLKNPKSIDTFDISYNAKIIMDIKTSALQILDCEDYWELLCRLYEPLDILKIHNMPEIVKTLPKQEQLYLQQMRYYEIFSIGLPPSKYPNSFPNEREYMQMREKIKKPFNFIWSDIESLHIKLDKKYDFIHLSNILDYIDDKKIKKIILSLSEYTNPGCNIYFESHSYYRIGTKKIRKCCEKISQITNQEWVFKEIPSVKRLRCVIHRVR
ncbi:MAG: DUF3419 family protein [Alphaproteobacteria bacterium]|nr:DUF3419 family protein [Alphaproteobacteria bacterium]